MEKLRVLVVDDSSVHRLALSEALKGIDGVEVVGTAPNGRIALTRIEQLRPDLVTLDVEMPEMDGIEMLRRLKAAGSPVDVLMVSVHTLRGTEVTLQALELGAFDFVTKPVGTDLRKNMDALRADLKRAIDTFVTNRLLRATRKATGPGPQQTPPAAAKIATQSPSSVSASPVEIVAVGISTGGPQVLGKVIPQLPADLPVPVVIVQHMPASFIGAMVASLDDKSRIRVVEGQDGMPLESGTVYLAPGEKQMKVTARANRRVLALTDDPPENHCKPAADYLFRSVAAVYGSRALGIIMTGMGADGREGLKQMKAQGARVIAQDEESCVVFGMPMEAIKAGVVDQAVPLERIAAQIVRMVGHGANS